MQKENQRCDITPFEIIHIEKYIIRNLYINSVGLALIYNWLNIKKKKEKKDHAIILPVGQRRSFIP